MNKMVILESHKIILDEDSYNTFNDNYMLYPEYDDLISQIEQMEDVNSYTITSSSYLRYSSIYNRVFYYGIIHAHLNYINDDISYNIQVYVPNY